MVSPPLQPCGFYLLDKSVSVRPARGASALILIFIILIIGVKHQLKQLLNDRESVIFCLDKGFKH
jgi:hypothetical protein